MFVFLKFFLLELCIDILLKEYLTLKKIDAW